ncbi:MAG: nucleotidyltransferase domain-containing protein [Planctomycetota bacterium]|nr:MAG: nucleotidyltransferase domain-containing protein [Planctomycetota bacterium]
MILYGSKARGNGTPESDIDLVVLAGRSLTPDDVCGMRAVVRQK